MIEQVYNRYYDTAGNYHWTGVHSGEHIVRKGEKMSDLIKRQDAIDVIEKLDIPEDMCVFEILSHIELAIGTLPPTNQWIPCSERSPEENGRYLVTRGLNACGSLWNRVYIVNYSDLMGLKKEKIWWDGNVGKSDFQTYEDVLAWQPIPETWKGEADGKIHYSSIQNRERDGRKE